LETIALPPPLPPEPPPLDDSDDDPHPAATSAAATIADAPMTARLARLGRPRPDPLACTDPPLLMD
jgi:hypothetical protein